MGSFLKIKGLPKVLSATGNLVDADIKSQSHWVVDTAGQTFTLPSPSAAYKNKSVVIGNASDGDAIFSGAFIAGASSATLGTGRTGMLFCLPTTEAMISTYKWALMGLPATVSPEGLTAAEIASIQGADSPSGANVLVATSALPVKATGAEVDTGTDDAKFLTPKAIEDSSYAKTAAIPVKASGAEVNTGTDDAKFVTAKAMADSDYATLNDVDSPSPTGIGTTITDCSAKVTPVDADLVLISDSADSNVGKKSTVAQLRSTLISADAWGTAIAGLAAKATPIDADSIAICDSADTNDAKETTIGELKAVILSADNVGGAIAGYAAKAVLLDADSIAVCDSADTNDAKETTIAELRTAMLGADGLGTGIAALDAKASPVDADSIVVVDSADTNNAKETTIAELRAVMLAADGLGTGIAALDAKASPVDADSIVVVDSADTNNAKETTVGELRSVLLAADPLGSVIASLDAKSTPIGADSIIVCDSADTNNAKETTITELSAVVLASNPIAAFDPDTLFAGGSAATVTAEVCRQKTTYDWCDWLMDFTGSDGGGNTTLTIDFPAALVPADVNMKIPCKAQVSVGGGAFANVLATLDCEAADAADRHLVVATGTLTDDAAFRIIISGGHQITPA